MKNKYMVSLVIIIGALFIFTGCTEIVKFVEEGEKITSGDNTAAISSSDTTVAEIKGQDVTVSTNNQPKVVERIPLYWTNTTEPHPERKPWTDAVYNNIDKYFQIYDFAADTTSFCPKYKSLSVDLKKKAIGELFVALAFYESGFNPKSESVDVGTKKDKGSWSVGLYQMSGNDGAAKALKVDYLGLKDPVKNINVALYQLNTQIKNTGLFILPNTSKYRYWAVLLSGNRYSKIPEIKARVLKYAPACK
jgi:hypothetical protein